MDGNELREIKQRREVEDARIARYDTVREQAEALSNTIRRLSGISGNIGELRKVKELVITERPIESANELAQPSAREYRLDCPDLTSYDIARALIPFLEKKLAELRATMEQV